MFSTLGGCVVSWSFLFFLCNERNDHSILNIAKVYLHLNKWKEATQCIANQKCVGKGQKNLHQHNFVGTAGCFLKLFTFLIIFFNYQECFSKFVSCCIIVKTIWFIYCDTCCHCSSMHIWLRLCKIMFSLLCSLGDHLHNK